jgi:cytochrome P450
LERSDDSHMDHLLSASRLKWKRMRNIMNPTFSSAKLRELGPLVIMCTDRLVTKLNENIDTEIDISQ